MFSADLNIAFEGEFCRVSQDVDQDLFQSLIVRFYHCRAVRRDSTDQEDVRLEEELHVDQLVDFCDQLRHINLIKVHFEFARLQLSEIEGVVNQGKQEGGGALTDIEVHLPDGCHVGPNASHTVLDRIDRCAQLVTD